jgi:hypothetical protein
MKGGLVTLVAVGVPILVVLAVLGLAVLAVTVAMVRRAAVMRRVMAASAVQVPVAPPRPAVERWAAGAYAVWTGGEDCATWTPERARESLSAWYGATDAAGLQRTIDGLVAGATGNAAWDRIRAIDLLRIGVAAGFLTQDQCWAQVRGMAGTLRAQYPSWEALAEGFETGMNAWHDSRGVTDPVARERVQRNLGALRSQIWPAIQYHAPL